jgi:hypothetical protein
MSISYFATSSPHTKVRYHTEAIRDPGIVSIRGNRVSPRPVRADSIEARVCLVSSHNNLKAWDGDKVSELGWVVCIMMESRAGISLVGGLRDMASS